MKTIEEKAKAYDETLERAKKELDVCGSQDCDAVRQIFRLFPELAESEDERVRKHLISLVKNWDKDGIVSKYTSNSNDIKQILAWLEKQGTKEVDPRYENLEELLVADNIYQMAMNEEMVKEAKSKAINALSELDISELLGLEKQGEQNPIDKIEPRFKIGDWITNKGHSYLIAAIEDDKYLFEIGGYTHEQLNWEYIYNADEKYHLWTIQNAKDGDVISNGEMIVIFKHFEDPSYRQHIVAYIGLDTIGNIQITDDTWNLGIDNAKPATKEQRDLLFQKMKEGGYEFDNVNKVLNGIAPNFKVGDWVVFNNNHESVYQIEKIENFQYTLRHTLGGSMPLSFSHEDMIRLWSIEDAKDGDVLVDSLSGDNQITILYKCIGLDTSVLAYCGWNGYNFRVTTDGTGYGSLSSTKYIPATKEQCELLFKKMKEWGYEWDAKIKKLININY